MKKLIAKPTFNKWVQYNESLAAIQLNRNVVELNKPRYIGQAILDLSKLVMYQFHYDFVMKKYPKAKLLFTDTGRIELFIFDKQMTLCNFRLFLLLDTN